MHRGKLTTLASKYKASPRSPLRMTSLLFSARQFRRKETFSTAHLHHFLCRREESFLCNIRQKRARKTKSNSR